MSNRLAEPAIRTAAPLPAAPLCWATGRRTRRSRCLPDQCIGGRPGNEQVVSEFLPNSADGRGGIREVDAAARVDLQEGERSRALLASPAGFPRLPEPLVELLRNQCASHEFRLSFFLPAGDDAVAHSGAASPPSVVGARRLRRFAHREGVTAMKAKQGNIAGEGSAERRGAKYRAAVVGGTGYGGAELIRLLLAHPEVALTRVASVRDTAGSYVGKPVESVHRNLTNTGLCFEQMSVSEVARGVDVVFLGLPHKVSCSLAPELAPVEARVIDLSGDYRLRDKAQYQKYYGIEHPYPEQLEGHWTFGLPELYRSKIRESRRVASPGCFATAVMLGLLPLAKAGLLSGAVQTVAATGSSGSGATAREGTHHPLRVNNMKIYKPLQHQHVPEIEQVLRDAGEMFDRSSPFKLFFVPVSAPLARGILANSFVRVPASTTPEHVDAIFHGFYEEAPLVRTLGSKSHAEVVAVKGSIWTDISWSLSPPDGAQRQLLVSSAIDNLVKGGAGQAVQSMNLMLGLPEQTGIDAPALWP